MCEVPAFEERAGSNTISGSAVQLVGEIRCREDIAGRLAA